MAAGQSGSDIRQLRRAEQIGRRVEEVAHHPGGFGFPYAPAAGVRLHQPGRCAFRRLGRGVSIGAERIAQRCLGGIVITRNQMPGPRIVHGGGGQAERQAAECEGRTIRTQAEHRSGQSGIVLKESQFLAFGTEPEIAQILGLTRRQLGEHRREGAGAYGVDRA